MMAFKKHVFLRFSKGVMLRSSGLAELTEAGCEFAASASGGMIVAFAEARACFKASRNFHERLAPKGASPRWDELA